MAFNYDYSGIMTGYSQRLGSFWVHMMFDVDTIMKGAFNNSIPVSTDFKIGKLKGGIKIRDGYYRVSRACTGNCDYTLGTTEAGTEITGAIPGDTATDWVQSSVTPNAKTINLAKATEDHYIWLAVTAAAVANGSIEYMLECVAGAEDNY